MFESGAHSHRYFPRGHFFQQKYWKVETKQRVSPGRGHIAQELGAAKVTEIWEGTREGHGKETPEVSAEIPVHSLAECLRCVVPGQDSGSLIEYSG